MDKFAPDIYSQSIFSINYKKLKKNGIKCLLFDLDNTIAPIHTKKPGVKEKELINGLQEMGFKVILFSNSGKTRLQPFKDAFNIDTAANSKKPLKGKYQKIMKLYNFKESEIACIGDQLLTDILGANRVGLTSILINPVSNVDFFATKFNRLLERPIRHYLQKKGLLTKGEYHD